MLYTTVHLVDEKCRALGLQQMLLLHMTMHHKGSKQADTASDVHTAAPYALGGMCDVFGDGQHCIAWLASIPSDILHLCPVAKFEASATKHTYGLPIFSCNMAAEGFMPYYLVDMACKVHT